MGTTAAIRFPEIWVFCAALCVCIPVDSAFAQSEVLRPSQRHLSPDEQIRFGYGLSGFGPRIPAGYRDLSDEELRLKADTGDAGAAHMLWQNLQSAARLEDAEEVASTQVRINGHTFLLHMMGVRYENADDPRAVVMWKACKELGDAQCGDRYVRAAARLAPDPAWVERETRSVLEKVRTPEA